MSDELTAFLARRLDEDEAVAGASADFDPESCADIRGVHLTTARVLREVGAKRKLIEHHAPGEANYTDRCVMDDSRWPCFTVRTVAAVYSDHPDYDPAWRDA